MKLSYSFIVAQGVKSLILFLQNSWGSIQHPYNTYRKLAAGKNSIQVIPLFLLCLIYFGWTTLIHVGLRSHPLLVSFNFVKLTIAFVATFFLVIGALFLVSRLFGGKGTLQNLFLPWSYSLMPTLIWFFSTSLLWLSFPPPRTASVQGQLLSFLFIVFSLFLFYWKGVLYYLTLRFGMRLDFFRIAGVSLVIFPLGALYAVILYRVGIFRIPFI